MVIARRGFSDGRKRIRARWWGARDYRRSSSARRMQGPLNHVLATQSANHYHQQVRTRVVPWSRGARYMDVAEHQRRVADFQADLHKMDTLGVIRKHITTGVSAGINDVAYYELRNEVAAHFKLHPSEVVVVGSCRTGFSLKPTKRYAAFTDASDVDLAIVSRATFDAYWDLVFEHWRTHTSWSETKRYRIFLKELFKGWLWPRRLPPRREFKEALEWVEFEDTLGLSRFNGLRSVGARLYRSWDRLEAYQAIHVLDCRNSLARASL
jgi:hypothetical protein